MKNKSTIGLIVPAATDYFWSVVIRSVEETARKHGYQVILATTNWNSGREVSQIKNFLKIGVKGIIVRPLDEVESVKCYLMLKRKGLPLLFINKNCNYSGIRNSNLITYNLRDCHSALDAESRFSTTLDSRFRGNDIH